MVLINPSAPTTPPLAQNPTARKRKWLWFLVLIAFLVGGYFLILNKPIRGCMTNSPSPLAKPPVVSHMYTSETIAYYKNDSRFDPVDESVTLKKNGKVYALELELGEPKLNPIFGSSITGKVWVTENGRRINNVPTNKEGLSLIPSAIPLKLVGVGLTAEGQGTLQRAGASSYPLSVTKNRLPFPITQAYSKSATEDGKLDLIKGTAEFTILYFGHRQLPYLEVVAGLSTFYDYLPGGSDLASSAWMAKKSVCYLDQSTKVKKKPELDFVAKGDFYYDLVTQPVQVKGNQRSRIKLDITARTSATKQIFTSAFQRVRIFAYPINNVAMLQSGDTGIIEPGSFVTEYDNKTIQGEIDEQSTKVTLVSARSNTRILEVAELDLIRGKGRIYFDYNGTFGDNALPTQLAFVVQPTNYYLSDADAQITDKATSFRTKQQIQYPDTNNETSGLPFRAKAVNPIPANRGQATINGFLYDTWKEDDLMRNEIFTVRSLAVSPARNSLDAVDSWSWIIGVGVIIFVVVILLRRRRKLLASKPTQINNFK